jgi:hypothetical protein
VYLARCRDGVEASVLCEAFFILLSGAVVLLYCLFPATSEGDSVVARKYSELIQVPGLQFAKRRLFLDLPRI